MINLVGSVPTKMKDTSLLVSVDGLEIHVAAGPFYSNGEMFELPSNETFVTEVREVLHYLNGYLVRVKDDNTVRLLVDEVLDEERAYRFTEEGPYEMLHSLFNAVVPPSTSDLDDVTLIVWRSFAPDDAPVLEPVEGSDLPPLDSE